MHTIDWLFLLVPAALLAVIAVRTRRHVKSVADFMTGGRVAGRYIVAVSDGVAGMGLITAIGMFEFYYSSGFAINHWAQIGSPVLLLVTLTGFVIYRFRETRAMTLAQFFEIRYSRRFRVFAGALCWVAGVLNYGIFPAVAGRFFVTFCGLPPEFALAGMTIPTFVPVMLIFLGVALTLVLAGGQLTTMVTDCVQGIMSYSLYVVIAVAVLLIFSWSQMSSSLLDRPEGMSMLDPFDTQNLQDFNLAYVLIGVFGSVYTLMAWQGNSGYNAAAANAHEAKMGKMLGTWRAGAMYVMLILLAVAAYTYLHHPDFAAASAGVRATLDGMDNEALAGQATVPLAVADFLPVGVVGAFLAVMMMLMVSTDTTYLHSWGSILVQDVILPIRGKPFTPRQQLKLLRWTIVGIAGFAFLFSWVYAQTTQIFMFMAFTGSLYLGGAGSVIIGGLYWKRATTQGAWASMLAGLAVAVVGFALEHQWPAFTGLVKLATGDPLPGTWLAAEAFPLNGQWVWMVSMVTAIVAFIAVSLGTSRAPFNMERMLHRGPYARADDRVPRPPRTIKAFLGLDAAFTRGDRWLAGFVMVWSVFFFGVWLVVTLWSAIDPWPHEWWAMYFWVNGILFGLLVGAITTVWFTWGGVRDLFRLFRDLETLERDDADDGRVIGHANADDAEAPGPVAEPAVQPTA